MEFYQKRKRQPPSVIIVPLIDILLALLMFLMVTTTFKTQPSIQLTLPKSRQAKPQKLNTEILIINISSNAPYFFLGTRPMNATELRSTLQAIAKTNREMTVTIRADQAAPWGKVVEAMDAIKEAGFQKPIAAFTRPANP